MSEPRPHNHMTGYPCDAGCPFYNDTHRPPTRGTPMTHLSIENLRPGIYRHYKGQLYQVLGVAHDANADVLSVCPTNTREEFYQAPLGQRTVVVYIGLQLDGASIGPRMAVRSVEDFFARLHVTNGSLCECVDRDPDTFPRFRWLGYEYQPWMSGT